MTQSEIKAAIRLLDDPDKEVYKIVKGKLLGEGSSVIESLKEAAYEPYADSLMQNRIETIVSKLELAEISQNLKDWISSGGDLLHGFWIVSRLKYFSLSLEDFKAELTVLKNSFPKYKSGNFSQTETIKIFNHFFYNISGFKSATQNSFFDPESCFVPYVLRNKTGNPISLAAVYMLLTESLGIRVRGINLPRNFILAYPDGRNNALFYINPFNYGAVFGSKEITNFLAEQNIKPRQQFYEPCLDNVIILRLLMHLEYSYRIKAAASKADDVSKLIKLFDYQLDKDISWL